MEDTIGYIYNINIVIASMHILKSSNTLLGDKSIARHRLSYIATLYMFSLSRPRVGVCGFVRPMLRSRNNKRMLIFRKPSLITGLDGIIINACMVGLK